MEIVEVMELRIRHSVLVGGVGQVGQVKMVLILVEVMVVMECN